MAIIAVATLFVFATPPFQAPDEVGHYWRAVTIARGALLPDLVDGKPSALVPRGVRDLVQVLWVPTAGNPELKVGFDRIRAAAHVSLQPHDLVRVTFPAQYTPVPQLPTVAACFIGMMLRLPPLITFYLGRACNAAALILLLMASIKRLPIAGAIGLLPMTLYLAGSFSPDAVTIGLACYVTALALTDGELIIPALLLALCKPAYVLLPLIARRKKLALLLAIGIGTALSAMTAQRNYFAMRSDVVTDPAAQLRFVTAHPFHFLGIVIRDYAQHALQYADHLVGHLGWLDIQLPKTLVGIAFILLIAAGVTASVNLSRATRITAAIILAASCLLISLSQYVAWTPLRAGFIAGMQGRYFLPLVPLALASIAVTEHAQRTIVRLFITSALVLDVIGVIFVINRYY